MWYNITIQKSFIKVLFENTFASKTLFADSVFFSALCLFCRITSTIDFFPGAAGLEPTIQESKSYVLPLHHTPSFKNSRIIASFIIHQVKRFVNMHNKYYFKFACDCIKWQVNICASQICHYVNKSLNHYSDIFDPDFRSNEADFNRKLAAKPEISAKNGIFR